MEEAREDLKSTVVKLGQDRVFSVHFLDNDAFAVASALHKAFGFASDGGFRGYLSRSSIKTVANDIWKRHLGLTGKIRFISREGLESLLRERFEKDADAALLETALNAPKGKGDQVERVFGANDNNAVPEEAPEEVIQPESVQDWRDERTWSEKRARMRKTMRFLSQWSLLFQLEKSGILIALTSLDASMPCHSLISRMR